MIYSTIFIPNYPECCSGKNLDFEQFKQRFELYVSNNYTQLANCILKGFEVPLINDKIVLGCAKVYDIINDELSYESCKKIVCLLNNYDKELEMEFLEFDYNEDWENF